MTNRVEVQSKVRVYERDGEEVRASVGVLAPAVMVRSHWNRSDLVVLEVGEATITVVASDLSVAIQNATNAG